MTDDRYLVVAQDIYEKRAISKFNVFPTHYKMRHGMCVQSDKPNSELGISQFYFPTEVWTGEIREYEVPWTDGKNHRTPYQKKTYNVMESFFKDWTQACYVLKNYKQVMSGLNHYRRDVIIQDFDIDYSVDKICDIQELCVSHNIPLFNYVCIHKKTNHFQVGWLLDTPFLAKKDKFFGEEYHTLRRQMNALFGGDPHCANGFIKNPLCVKDIDTKWYSKVPVDREELLCFVNLASDSSTEAAKPSKKRTEKKVKTFTNDLGSRNCFAFNEGRTLCFQYMNKHNGEAPSMDWMMETLIKLEEEFVKYDGRTIETVGEIKSTANSVLNFCKANWKKNAGGAGSYNYEYGHEVQTAQKHLKCLQYFKLVREGYSKKEISEIMEVGLSTLYRYKDEQEARDYLTEFYKSHKRDYGRLTNEICEEIELYIEFELVEPKTEEEYFQLYAIHNSSKYRKEGVNPWTFIRAA